MTLSVAHEGKGKQKGDQMNHLKKGVETTGYVAWARNYAYCVSVWWE
jgi:hypothetical protein